MNKNYINSNETKENEQKALNQLTMSFENVPYSTWILMSLAA